MHAFASSAWQMKMGLLSAASVGSNTIANCSHLIAAAREAPDSPRAAQPRGAAQQRPGALRSVQAWQPNTQAHQTMGDQSWDPTTRATVQKIPLLTVKAGPRDKDEWGKRLKEVGCVAGAAAA